MSTTLRCIIIVSVVSQEPVISVWYSYNINIGLQNHQGRVLTI